MKSTNDPDKPLQSIRQSRGVSQNLLAMLTGLSQPHLAHVENGDRSLSLEKRAAIVRALGLTREEIRRCPELTYEDLEASKTHHPSRLKPKPEEELTDWQRSVGSY